MTEKPYQNKHDTTGDCAKVGKKAEDSFRELAEKRGYAVQVSSREQQFAHIDFILTKGQEMWKVDVKGAKKISRKHNDPCFEHIWLEFKTGHGKDGWLVSEGCDSIAFEIEDSFVVVGRKDLLNLAKSLCNLEKRVDSAKKALYCGYKRFGRQDLLSLIKTTDLYQIKHSIWPKNSNSITANTQKTLALKS